MSFPTPSRLIIRWVTPLVWKVFPGRRRHAIGVFAATEKDSGCQLLQCADLVQDPKLRAHLFQHALEEFNHADLFASVSDARRAPVSQRDYLISRSERDPGKLAAFYAYANVAEGRINANFRLYARAVSDARQREAFERVANDEDRHEHGTQAILLRLCGMNRGMASRLVLGARIKHSYRAYSARMRRLGHLPLTAALTVLYYVFGVLSKRESTRRLTLPREEQSRILLEDLALELPARFTRDSRQPS